MNKISPGSYNAIISHTPVCTDDFASENTVTIIQSDADNH